MEEPLIISTEPVANDAADKVPCGMSVNSFTSQESELTLRLVVEGSFRNTPAQLAMLHTAP